MTRGLLILVLLAAAGPGMGAPMPFFWGRGDTDDVAVGTAGADELHGGDGADRLVGNGGRDVLSGGIDRERDVLIGDFDAKNPPLLGEADGDTFHMFAYDYARLGRGRNTVILHEGGDVAWDRMPKRDGRRPWVEISRFSPTRDRILMGDAAPGDVVLAKAHTTPVDAVTLRLRAIQLKTPLRARNAFGFRPGGQWVFIRLNASRQDIVRIRHDGTPSGAERAVADWFAAGRGKWLR